MVAVVLRSLHLPIEMCIWYCQPRIWWWRCDNGPVTTGAGGGGGAGGVGGNASNYNSGNGIDLELRLLDQIIPSDHPDLDPQLVDG